MSYTIIKSVTFDERKKEFHLTGCSNNVSPRRYYRDYWIPSHMDYEKWKVFLAEQLWGGSAVFLPSCNSKAKRAYEIAYRDTSSDRAAVYQKNGGSWHMEDMVPVYDKYLRLFLKALNALIDPRFARLNRLFAPAYGDEWFMDIEEDE